MYKERSEHARDVATFVEMMRRQYPDKKAELLDVETREGAAVASMYDIMQYPAVMITAYDGSVHFLQQGKPMPRVGEVAGQLHTQAFSV